jgi:hypothetical protein
MSTTEMPKFKHDCDECKFLGTFKDADLYVCPETERVRKACGDTFITRYSDDAWDYSSYDETSLKVFEELYKNPANVLQEKSCLTWLFEGLKRAREMRTVKPSEE